MTKLTEDDVPGTKLFHEDAEKHCVVPFQRWLKCLGSKCTGLKPELVQSVGYVTGLDLNETDVKVDFGKWLELKKETEKASSWEHSPILPVTGWNAFPFGPLPNYEHIHHYFITAMPMTDEGENPHTSEPLVRGKFFCTNGRVRDMEDIMKETCTI